jgi:hypothetical protein
MAGAPKSRKLQFLGEFSVSIGALFSQRSGLWLEPELKFAALPQ